MDYMLYKELSRNFFQMSFSSFYPQVLTLTGNSFINEKRGSTY